MPSHKKSVADLKNALAKTPPKNVLQEAPVAKPKTAPRKTNPAGRPPVAEKRTVKITLSFTEKEGALISKKAGLIPQAPFLLSKLAETDLFTEKE